MDLKPKPAVQVTLPVHGATVGVCRMSPYLRIKIGPEFERLQAEAKESDEGSIALLEFMMQIAIDHVRTDEGDAVFTSFEDPNFTGFDGADFGEIAKAALGAEGDLDGDVAENIKKRRKARKKSSNRRKSK